MLVYYHMKICISLQLFDPHDITEILLKVSLHTITQQFGEIIIGGVIALFDQVCMCNYSYILNQNSSQLSIHTFKDIRIGVIGLFLYPRSPKEEGGILFYLCPSVCPSFRPSFRPSKIFFVAFFSVTVDGRNLIFGHKYHIGIPYCGQRFWIRQIPTSCLPKSGGIISEHQLTVHLVFVFD